MPNQLVHRTLTGSHTAVTARRVGQFIDVKLLLDTLWWLVIQALTAGACSCAPVHEFLEDNGLDDWCPPAARLRVDMLEFRQRNARIQAGLYCQMTIFQDNMDAIGLRLPESSTDCPGANMTLRRSVLYSQCGRVRLQTVAASLRPRADSPGKILAVGR